MHVNTTGGIDVRPPNKNKVMYVHSYGVYIIIVTLTESMWTMCDRLPLPPYDVLLTFSSKSFISSTKAFHESLESGCRNL